jgi:hypothetical protein
MITGVSTVLHPEAIDDEYLSIDPTGQDRIQPIGRPSRMAFFIYTLRLSDIASRIRQSVRRLYFLTLANRSLGYTMALDKN